MAYTERASNRHIRSEINELFSSVDTVETDLTNLEIAVNLLDGSGIADNQVANTVLAGPTTGADDLPTFRALVADDLPANIGGLVSNQSANTILAGPVSGGAAAPTYRTLVANDLPDVPASKLPYATVFVSSTTPASPDLTALGNPRVLFVSMTGTGARTVNLPALSAALIGLIVIVKDTANAAATGNITITPAGGNTFVGSSTITSNGFSTRCVALSATQWGSF